MKPEKGITVPPAQRESLEVLGYPVYHGLVGTRQSALGDVWYLTERGKLSLFVGRRLSEKANAKQPRDGCYTLPLSNWTTFKIIVFLERDGWIWEPLPRKRPAVFGYIVGRDGGAWGLPLAGLVLQQLPTELTCKHARCGLLAVVRLPLARRLRVVPKGLGKPASRTPNGPPPGKIMYGSMERDYVRLLVVTQLALSPGALLASLTTSRHLITGLGNFKTCAMSAILSLACFSTSERGVAATVLSQFDS
jgi:hypothetical protein